MADSTDRLALAAAQDAWAASQQAPEHTPAPLPTHHDEVMGAHGCVPSPAASAPAGVTASSGG